MNRKIKKMAAIILSITICIAIMIILPSTSVFAGEKIYNNSTGTHGGYDYELWKDYGNTTMELNDNGTFSCQWSNINNALFRKGKKFNSDKTYQQIGEITVDYGCQYNPSGNSYLCVYGWTRNPLVEYYIVDSWGSWRPPGATPKGTITVDGGTYDVYVTTRVNQPSIDGTKTFQQYWSVRTSKRTSGTISVSEHFRQWERMGMKMGNMYEVALTVEGYQSSGSANVYKNDIKIGTSPSPSPSPNPTPNPNPNKRSAFSTIEAEQYNSSKSSTLQVIGTSNNGKGIGYIENGNTVTYSNIDFGSGATKFNATVATQNNTSIQIRSDSATGTLLGTLNVGSTGGWNTYKTLSTNISKITGVHDIVLVFSGPVNVDNFIFSGASSDTTPSENTRNAYSNIQAEDYNSSYGPNLKTFSLANGGKAIGYIENGYSTTYKNINFADGCASITARVATQYATSIQVRLGSASGTLLGTINVGSTGSFDTYKDVTANISNTTGVKDIVLVFSGPVNVDSFVFSKSKTSPDLSDKKLVALTFDDGPNKTTTQQILDILEREGVVATFFLIGSNINDSTKPVMQRQVSLGCELANHSWSHKDMTSMSNSQIQQEITNTNNKIQQMVGVTPKFFRPPYISANNTMYNTINLPFIGGLTCNDWDNSTSAAQRASTVLNNVKDGDIILLHDFDGNYNTVQALSTIIKGLKDKNYTFVTVSQLFELKGVNPNVKYKIWNGAY